MSDKQPQQTDVLVKRLMRVAKWLDQKEPQATTPQGRAQIAARANTCWQAAGRLDTIIEILKANGIAVP